jgi:hypothetical protein
VNDEAYTSGEQLSAEQAKAMLEYYAEVLEKQGYEPIAYPNKDAVIGGSVYRGAKYDVLNEAYWMCERAQDFIREGRWSKALRWIGFIQGLLWFGGLFSIVEIKSHDRLGPHPSHGHPAEGNHGAHGRHLFGGHPHPDAEKPDR